MQCNSRTHINKWYQLQPATNRWKENSQTHFAWTCHFWRSAWCPNVAQAWLATAWRGWRPSQVQHNGQQREAETCFVLLFQWEESSFAKSFNAGVSGYARCQASPYKWPARQAKGFQGPNMNKKCFEVATSKATWKYGARIEIKLKEIYSEYSEQRDWVANRLSMKRDISSALSFPVASPFRSGLCEQFTHAYRYVYVILCWLSILLVFTYQSLSISLSNLSRRVCWSFKADGRVRSKR